MKFELNVDQYDPHGDAYYTNNDYPQGHFAAAIKYFPVTLDDNRYILDIEINPQREKHTFSLSDDRENLKTLYWGQQWIGSITMGPTIPLLHLNGLARECFRQWRELSSAAARQNKVPLSSNTNDMAYILGNVSIFNFHPGVTDNGLSKSKDDPLKLNVGMRIK